MTIDDNFGLGPARGWLTRYRPMFGAIHLLFAGMAVQVSLNVWHGGSPITPELYGPAVHMIPALVWSASQIGVALVTVLGLVMYWPRVVTIGAASSFAFYLTLSALSAFAEQGVILHAGALWVFVPLSAMTTIAGLGAWGRQNVRR